MMGSPRTYIFFITIQLIYVVASQEMVKRVPQGFLGMRGKKYIESGETEFYKRKPQFFVGVKGKKNLDYPYNTEFEYKRAPMGFVGMRGKKEFSYPEYIYPENFEYIPKKTGSLIGKIDYSTDDSNFNNQEYSVIDEIINEYLKKLRSNTYKEPETNSTPEDAEEMTNEVDKRAKMHQFYGVRGKKSIPDKRPYDLTFRGKFIGVRGKKNVKDSGAHELKFLLNGPWPKRRGQMGFVGMRGKKWMDDTTSEEIVPN